MGLFHSLYTSAAGMNAQTRSTNVISENIANINTTGYKRSNTAFQDLVTNTRYGSSGTGTVQSTTINRITQQGSIQQTSSSTDVAIAGSGFFVVRSSVDDPEATDLYTRNGTFDNDAEGYLRNSAGYYLYGWAIDDAGTVDTGTLVPVDIDVLATTSRPTSAAEMVLNLDAAQIPYDPHTQTPAQELPVDNLSTHFTRSLTVYDGNGTARQMFFDFRKIVGPMAHFTSDTQVLNRDDALVDPIGPTPSIIAGDTMEIVQGTQTLTISFVSGTADTSLNEAATVQDLIDVINNFTGTGTSQLFNAELTSDGRLLVRSVSLSASSTMDITTSSASVLGAGGLNFILDPDSADYTYDRDASLAFNGVANPNQTDFPAFASTTNPLNWWEMVVSTIDPSDPSGTTQVEISKGLINFNGDGSLNATLDANGQAILDLPAIDFDTADATDDIAMTVDITGFTQFTGNYTVGYLDQNGAPLGEFSGTEITTEGVVLAVFTNGIKLESYQLPLATFVNPNGLRRIDGTAFAETELSGAVTLAEPAESGAGVLQVAALENANVDLSEEFGGLIVTQRAYSLNGQIINAVDEMTQTLSRLFG